MSSKRIRPIPKSKEDELFDALIGPDEEIDMETAQEVLQIHGISSSELLAKLKSRVEADARNLRGEGKTVPVPMQNALKNLQAATAQPIKPDPMNVDPNTHIECLLGRTARATGSAGSKMSLRGRKSGELVSGNDKNLIDELKAEVNEKAKD